MPTLGRPIKAILSAVRDFCDQSLFFSGDTSSRLVVTGVRRSFSAVVSESSREKSCLLSKSRAVLKMWLIADLSSLMPCPVVAEMRKVCAGLMPRRRNSSSGRESPRSDLFSRSSTGFLDLRADLAICLSLSSGYLVLSRVRRMSSALSIASVIWS